MLFIIKVPSSSNLFIFFRMLDELSTDMERTGMKLNELVKKIAKVTNMNDGLFKSSLLQTP